MYSPAVLQEMADASTETRKELALKVAAVLALVEKYRRLGRDFTFGYDKALDAQVNKMLAELSDSILEDTEIRMKRAIEAAEAEDSDEIISWVKNDKDAIEKLDKYASHLKYILEGWIAIGFYEKMSKTSILNALMTYIVNPYISPQWARAFKEGEKYASQIIRSGGYHWGAGTPISPLKGMTLMATDMINTAYNQGVISKYRRSGAVGYRVHRGSTYYCPECDALCIGIHKVSDVVLPAHPNCMCYTTPVYSEE